ncbi:uncharacterized protein LOC132923107 isoform X2 [Rhopalosiphum padi]|uniref:uncharacterized protein LOC132923107 isoform X2 n=1 Tax=Rhopalosiphum padi TaxID=40932 RepID=UPI00298D8F66|nr:uncharacterized protein LOC132923107 isoform X2 [Rhopalosiphum padi]
MFIYLAYHRKLKDGFKDITELKNQESNYVRNFKRAYDATKKAYEAVEEFENYVNKSLINKSTKEDYEKKKNDAIQEYLQNQMPELNSADVNWGGNTENTPPRYVFENYELYVNPTEDIYYMSNVKQAEHDSIEKRTKGGVT